MNPQSQAAWRKMVGTAFLWVAFAVLVYLPSTGGGARSSVIACLGFISFATGLGLFAEGLKRDIVEQLRRGRSDQPSP